MKRRRRIRIFFGILFVVAIPVFVHHEKKEKFHVKFSRVRRRALEKKERKREEKYEMRLVELKRGQFSTRHHKFCSLHTAYTAQSSSTSS